MGRRPPMAAEVPGAAWRRHFPWALLACAALGVLLRLWAGAGLSGCPTATAPLAVTDMATYRTLALQIRQGQWPPYFDYQPFYYTVFLPLAYCFSPSGGIWPVIVLQALLGGATVALTGLAAARLFGRRAGLAAALLLALSRFHVFYCCFPLLEVWFSFWCVAVLCLLLRLCRGGGGRWWVPPLLGLCCAGALLTRGSALLWLPGILALVVWRLWRQPRRLLLALTLAALGFILPLVPYCVHNSRHFGRFCGPSVAGGKVMVLGNSPEAPAGGLEYPRTYHLWCDQATRGQRGVLSNILGWAAREPGAFLELECRKLLLFWDKSEIPNNISYQREGSYSRLLPWLLPWSVLGTLGAAGYLLLLRLRRRNLPLLWMALVFWLGTSAFYILARFRVGFLPLLCIGAAFTLGRLWHARRIPALRPPLALALCSGLLLVVFAYDSYCDFAVVPIYRALRPDGLALDFPGEAVSYDHGPMTTASAFVLDQELPVSVLEKRLAAPPVPPAGFGTAQQRQQLRLLLAGQGGGRPAYAPSQPPRLILDGRPAPAAVSVQRHFQSEWLVLDFTAPLPESGRQHLFTISFFGGPPPLVFDRQRDYGRTMLRLEGQEVSPGGEVVAEWVVPKPPVAE